MVGTLGLFHVTHLYSAFPELVSRLISKNAIKNNPEK